MTGRERAGLAAGLLIGAAAALPLGMMLGQSDSRPTPSRTLAPSASSRAVYSPKVLSDPYFLEQERKGIEALEQACARRGELCAEARQGRRWLEQAAR